MRIRPVIEKDDQLLVVLARRNWYILAALVLLSLLWRSVAVVQGVLAGGLVAIIAFGWLYRSLRKALANPDQSAARGFQMSFFVRLGALGMAVFLLLVKGGVNPVALAVGLSVVIINILWMTCGRLL